MGALVTAVNGDTPDSLGKQRMAIRMTGRDESQDFFLALIAVLIVR